MSHSIASILERRKQVAKCASEWCNRWYNKQGDWLAKTIQPDTRKTLWLCLGLLAGSKDDIALANAILGKLEFHSHIAPRTEQEARAPFDIFVTNHAVQTLVLHKSHLTPEVASKLETWARSALNDYPGDRQCDYQFHGFNDNMPSKATLGMVLGGEYFGDKEAVAHGIFNLKQLRSILTRRGLLSEYTSPTYSPLSIVNLTEVALHAKNEEARQLASLCVERIWSDLLGHYHLPTGTIGGPYSRAYQLDSTAHYSTAACLLWIVFGNTSFNPIDEINRDPVRLVHHHDDRATQLGVLCWVASCDLRPPQYLVDWLQQRKYPFHLLASAERGGKGGTEVNTVSYAEEDFSIGSAEGDIWTEHQTEAYFMVYRRQAPIKGVEDVRTLYARYLINDERPGDRESDHNFKSFGVVHTLHKDRIALVLPRPSHSLEGKEVTSLRFTAVLPTHFSKIEKIEIRGKHVFIKDGPVHIALRGLNATDWGRKDSIRVENVPNYQLISFFNYEGKPTKFTRDELNRTLAGFISIVGLEKEESFDAFIKRVEQAEIVDILYYGARTITYQLGDTHLSTCYNLDDNFVRYATVDYLLKPRPIWEADGLSAEKLPFLSGTVHKGKLEFPHKHLNVIWGNEPWAIAESPLVPNGNLSENGWDKK